MGRRRIVCRLAATGLPKLMNLLDGRFDVGKRAGSWPATHDQLKDLRILHFVYATQIGHDDGHGTAHSGPAADQHVLVRMVRAIQSMAWSREAAFASPNSFSGILLVDHSGRRMGVNSSATSSTAPM